MNYNHVYIRGDVHGLPADLVSFAAEHKTTREDLMIILGDCGFMIDPNNTTYTEMIFGILGHLDLTFLCLRGNHDMRPSDFPDTKLVDVGLGDPVYVYKNVDNVLFAVDGNTYNINDRAYLAIGGAYSIDKNYRLIAGLPWFPNEQLSQEEMDEIFEKVKGKHFDVVLTHTAPLDKRPIEMLAQVSVAEEDTTMENWFQKLRDVIDYHYWFCGHYHCDRVLSVRDHMFVLFNRVVDIGLLAWPPDFEQIFNLSFKPQLENDLV